MILLSWLSAQTSATLFRRSAYSYVRKVILLSGYASCSVLSVGCLYLGPYPYMVEDNMPPEILSFTSGSLFCGDYEVEEDELCVVEDEQKVFVTATDEDGDLLEFAWSGNATGAFNDDLQEEDGPLQSSTIWISPDEVMDGETLTCIVLDGSPDRTSKEWLIREFQ